MFRSSILTLSFYLACLSVCGGVRAVCPNPYFPNWAKEMRLLAVISPKDWRRQGLDIWQSLHRRRRHADAAVLIARATRMDESVETIGVIAGEFRRGTTIYQRWFSANLLSGVAWRSQTILVKRAINLDTKWAMSDHFAQLPFH